MRFILTLCAAAATLSSCTGVPSPQAQRFAASEDARLMKVLAGQVAQKPKSCIALNDIQSSEYFGDKTILYRVSRKLVYRNDPRGGCHGMDANRTMVTRTFSGMLCSGDTVTPVDLTSGIQSGTCILDDFVPYKG